MMDCILPICNTFLFYYIYIVFDLSLNQQPKTEGTKKRKLKVRKYRISSNNSRP